MVPKKNDEEEKVGNRMCLSLVVPCETRCQQSWSDSWQLL
jgi:hypothetical protein